MADGLQPKRRSRQPLLWLKMNVKILTSSSPDNYRRRVTKFREIITRACRRTKLRVLTTFSYRQEKITSVWIVKPNRESNQIDFVERLSTFARVIENRPMCRGGGDKNPTGGSPPPSQPTEFVSNSWQGEREADVRFIRSNSRFKWRKNDELKILLYLSFEFLNE